MFSRMGLRSLFLVRGRDAMLDTELERELLR